MRISRTVWVPIVLVLIAGCGNRIFPPKVSAPVIAPPKPVVQAQVEPQVVAPVQVAVVEEPIAEPVAEPVVVSVVAAPEAVAVAVVRPKPAPRLIKRKSKLAITLANLTRPTDVKARSDVMAADILPEICPAALTKIIPDRKRTAMNGSQVVSQVMALSGTARDTIISDQLLAGNVPSFLRQLTPVTFSGQDGKGRDVQVIICVTPDYLAVGDDKDFVRVPMGLPAAAKVADNFNFLLPTTRMVDAIYTQAGIRLSPSPMQASSQMSSTDYLWKHNKTVEGQRAAVSQTNAVLLAGQKKDLVLSNVLRSAPGKVAIYGWHRTNGVAIQPLSTVHVARYADYSHGVRLVSDTAYVNGVEYSLSELLQDPKMAAILSKEGPIRKPRRLIASLYR